ncbi:MAG: hypothetical protein NTU80_06700 [Verrucomicrobia bacterium]|nr:hypothetical protein [Verrucomicrobiota bacterium]
MGESRAPAPWQAAPRKTTDWKASRIHVSFTEFYSYCEHINTALLAEVGNTSGGKYHSQSAELLKRCADRSDITFDAIKEADVLAQIASQLRDNRWYPQTHYYWGWGRTTPFFSAQSKTSISPSWARFLDSKSGDELRAALEGKKANIDRFNSNVSVEEFIGLSKLDTLK